MGQEARHIARVLRKKPGDVLRLFDGKGSVFFGEITEAVPERVAGRVLEHPPAKSAAAGHWPWEIHLYQALPKGSKWDWVLEKGTEVGVTRFVPLISERTIVRVPSGEVSRKTARWRKIVQAAAKQCGVARLPIVEEPQSFGEALQQASKKGGLLLFAWESELAEPIWTALANQSKPSLVSLFIGPEGGWSLDEAETAKKAGTRPVGLGPQVLRTETAPIAAIAMLNALLSR